MSSLIRRFSSRRRAPKEDSTKQVAIIPTPEIPKMTPKPAQRQMTTANLFQEMNSASVQSTAMDRTLYEIPQPTNVDAMTDLVKKHERGTLFPYVGVVGSEGESSDARRARMLALKPSYNRRDVPEIVVLGCPLIKREGTFTMDSLMEFAKQNVDPIVTTGPMPTGSHHANFTITKPYVHIRQVTVLYTPNVSSTSNYCNFWINLVDNRLIDSDRGSQTNVVVSNQEGILEMSCDYCVSVEDLKSFALSYTLERDIVHPGYQWGTCSFYFSITESDLPFQSSKVDAMAVYRMPITTLMKKDTNADKSDISFTPADLIRLRDLYQQGDIVDVDEPKTARLKTNTYSKSSIRSSKKGEKMENANKGGWEFMSGAIKPKVDAHEASVEPEDEDEEILVVDQEAIDKARKETLARYKAQQESEREKHSIADEEPKGSNSGKEVVTIDSESEHQEDETDGLSRLFAPKSKGKGKQVQFGASNV